MKTEELRIGNILREKYTGDILVVSELTKNRITFDYQTTDKWQADPIPLSEEILLKCGFNKTSYGYKYHMENILEFVLRNNNIYLGYFDDDGWCRIGKPIKYIHQLQNLFYAITGQELEVSL